MEGSLYSYWRSSSSWRVRIVLAYKNITHNIIPINLLQSAQTDETYLDANPMAQVPTYKVGNLKLTQSLAIFHYLEDQHGPSMLPSCEP